MEIEAKDVKVGDKVKIDDEGPFTVKKVETSDIGKHGSVKVRLELIDDQNEESTEILLADDEVEKLE
jgi:translation elongation factor P/translation initiation factor 5A